MSDHKALNDALRFEALHNTVTFTGTESRDDMNAAIRRAAGWNQVRLDTTTGEELPEPAPERYAAGSGDGGRGGPPLQTESPTDQLNRALRDMAAESKGGWW